MPKPVSSDEVEDVLSSIRRLVSEDKRPLQNTAPKPANSRLMLTPALRVASEDADETPDLYPDAPPEEAVSTSEAISEESLDLSTDESAQDLADTSDDDHRLYDTYRDEPDEDETASGPIPAKWQEDDLVEDHLSDDFWFEERKANDKPDIEADVAVAADAAVDAEAGFDAEADADAEAAFDDQADEGAGLIEDSEEAVAEAEVGEDLGEEEFDDEDLHDDTGYLEAEAEAEAEIDDDDDEEEERATAIDASALTAKIAALETAIGSIRQEWEPDDPGSDAYSGTKGAALEWEDNVELDARGKPIKLATPFEDDAQSDEIDEAAFEADRAERLVDAVPVPAAQVEAADPVPAGDDSDAAEEHAELEASDTGGAAMMFRHAEVDRITVRGTHPDDAALPADEAGDEGQDRPDVATLAEDDPTDGARFEEAAFEEYAARFDDQTAEPEGSDETVDQQAPDEGQGGLGLGGDDAILDEDMLRDLVSEIVRAELQGALGERITRNVRKLVRREIHRALAAQDLD